MLHLHNSEVQSKIRSSFVITTVTQCIQELVLNSLDASASIIKVFLDAHSRTVEVNDNGCGFTRKNLELAGSKYSTSKCSSLEDLRTKLNHYGFRGEALFSIAQMSSELRISTSYQNQICSKTISNFGKIHQCVEVDDHYTNTGNGSTIMACNLFSNLCIRVRSFVPFTEIEHIKEMLRDISLVHASVSISFCEKQSSFNMKFGRFNNLYTRVNQLLGINLKNHISKKFGKLTVDVHFATVGYAKKSIQNVYVNKRIVHQTKIHAIMKGKGVCNRLMKNTAGHSSSTHPAYIILITCPFDWYDIGLEPGKTLVEFSDWKLILSTIEDMFADNPTQNIADSNKTLNHNQNENLMKNSTTDVELLDNQSSGSDVSTEFEICTDLVCLAGRTARRKRCIEDCDENREILLSWKCGSINSKRSCSSQLILEDAALEVKENRNNAEDAIRQGWVEKYAPKVGKFYINSATGVTSFIKPTETCSNRDKTFADCTPQLQRKGESACQLGRNACSTPWSSLRCHSSHRYLHKASSINHFPHQSPITFDVKKNLQVIESCLKTPCKLSKAHLQNLQVIGQISNEFIACVAAEDCTSHRSILLFDQHAVHERIRLEAFIKEAVDDSQPHQVRSTKLDQPLELDVEKDELRALQSYKKTFENVGLGYEVVDSLRSTERLKITKIPALLCSKDIKATLKELIRERTEILQRGDATGITIPPTLFTVLCSRACHGAIRFGDALTKEECSSLMKRLATCKLPFQCAHGRPSVCPLLDLDELTAKKAMPCKLHALKAKMKSKETLNSSKA